MPEPEERKRPDSSGFQLYKSKYRKPGTGGVYQLGDHLWEGNYSPRDAHGKRISRSVYAKTREECEERLATMIEEVKKELLRKRKKWRLPLERFEQFVNLYEISALSTSALLQKREQVRYNTNEQNLFEKFLEHDWHDCRRLDGRSYEEYHGYDTSLPLNIFILPPATALAQGWVVGTVRMALART